MGSLAERPPRGSPPRSWVSPAVAASGRSGIRLPSLPPMPATDDCVPGYANRSRIMHPDGSLDLFMQLAADLGHPAWISLISSVGTDLAIAIAIIPFVMPSASHRDTSSFHSRSPNRPHRLVRNVHAKPLLIAMFAPALPEGCLRLLAGEPKHLLNLLRNDQPAVRVAESANQFHAVSSAISAFAAGSKARRGR